MNMTSRHIGVMPVNTGTPDELSPQAVREYLARFLSDKRIVRLPSSVWKPILHGIVLRTRPARTLPRYEKVWTPEGALYTLISRGQERALKALLNEQGSDRFSVRLAQRYGTPSIDAALEDLSSQTIDELVVLPLYPQSAYSTTMAVRDEFERVCAKHDSLPPIRFIDHYGDNELYLKAIADQIRRSLNELPAPEPGQEPYRGVFSFHSIPHADMRDGDDYFDQVKRSVARIEELAGVDPDAWTLGFASRFDSRSWLGPFIKPVLAELALKNCRSVVVICPGFATDCIETRVEIAEEARDFYLEHASASHPDVPHDFIYIDALNDSPAHIEALASVINEALASG